MPLNGTDMMGRAHSIKWGGELPTLIYIFSPTCPWCEKNKDSVRALMQGTADRFSFIGIGTGVQDWAALREHVQAKYPENMPAYYVDQPRMVAFGMTGTPQTIVVSPDGTVLKNWSGAYMETVGREVRAYFGLPDLPMVQRSTSSPTPAPTAELPSAPGHPKPTP